MSLPFCSLARTVFVCQCVFASSAGSVSVCVMAASPHGVRGLSAVLIQARQGKKVEEEEKEEEREEEEGVGVFN